MPIHDWSSVNAGLFHHFHHEWISSLGRALNGGLLPPDYFALAEQVTAGPIPDVVTLERRVDSSTAPAVGGTALLTTPPQTRFVLHAEESRYAARASHVAIRHTLGKVVAVIEIVSPGNKASRAALRAFVEKSVRFIQQGVHLLVIDLFPPGPRDPQGIHQEIWREIQDDAFVLPADKRLILAAYQAREGKTAYVEPIAAGDALPAMPLFLDEAAYVPAPLEATYLAAWNACPTALREVVPPV